MEPDGISDIEGKVARVATSKLGNERVSIDRFIAEDGKGPYPKVECTGFDALPVIATLSQDY